MAGMTSFKPFLFRAYYDWLVENEITPHLMVDTSVGHVKVPEAYIRNNQIVLTLAPRAVDSFSIEKQGISFKSRFGGVSEDVYIPYRAMKELIAVEKNFVLPVGQAFAAFDSDEENYDEDFDDHASENAEGFKITKDDGEDAGGGTGEGTGKGTGPAEGGGAGGSSSGPAFEILSEDEDKAPK